MRKIITGNLNSYFSEISNRRSETMLCNYSVTMLIALLVAGCSAESKSEIISNISFAEKEQQLLKILGDFPDPPPLEVDTLEAVELDNGWRYKIEYTAEEADTIFDTPVDRIKAYLFVPDHEEGEKLPAMVAIHQDGPQMHLGKLEPAGLAGAKDQHYGLELFNKGYVVICPDRFPHAERRRITDPDTAGTDRYRDTFAAGHWLGQLILSDRTSTGKEVYDLMRATDVLYSLGCVDKERIGAIGHSAGGYNLVYFMFVDKRIIAGVSSCGFFELIDFYNEHVAMKRLGANALPGLAKIGKSADYLALLAPRPFMMTRGLWEWGKEGKWKQYSKEHVAETKEIEDYARQRYSELEASENLKTIYFDEKGGDHAFPPKLKKEVFQWLDSYLMP
ncbi:alpha/beta hydrolase family protein [Gemmatimonadota bacterium]